MLMVGGGERVGGYIGRHPTIWGKGYSVICKELDHISILQHQKGLGLRVYARITAFWG